MAQDHLAAPSDGEKVMHDSDCSVHNEPALPAAPCDCSAWPKEYHRLHMAALKAYAASEGEENYTAFAAADDALWAFVKHNIRMRETATEVAAPSDGEREAFEAWAKPRWGNVDKAYFGRELMYQQQELQREWYGWKAASAARSAKIQQLRGALEELHNWLVCWPIASAEDMAQSFPRMEELASAALKEPS